MKTNFFIAIRYDKEKQVLLSLITRRLNLFIENKSAIDKLKNFFSPNDAKERSRIDRFLKKINKDYFLNGSEFEYYPCILIVDEVKMFMLRNELIL